MRFACFASATTRQVLDTLSRISAISLGLVSASCAYSYVDSNNVRHIVGFVDVSLPAIATESSGPTPTTVSITSVGVHVYSGTANGSGLVLGYGRETVLTMPDNSCVDIAAPGLCAETANGRKQP